MNIINWLLNASSFSAAYDNIIEMKTNKGLALEDIVTELHLCLHRMELPPPVMNQLVIKMAEIERRLASGCSEKPQVAALIAAFQIARDLVTLDEN